MAKPVGISLSGGAVRGIAHIGVLQALEEHNIYPEYISGASAGALVGVLYAADYRPEKILEVFKSSTVGKLFKVGLPMTGLSDNAYLIEVIKQYVEQDSFEALPKRLFVSLTNMTTGQYEIKSEGELYRVIAASAAIPVLFQGYRIGNELYADGGVLNNLPIEPLLGRCHPIIGVNVTPIQRKEEINGLLEVGYRTFDLVMWGNVEPRLKQCDIVLEPGADSYSLFNLKAADEIFQLGYDAALKKMPQILRLLDPTFQGYSVGKPEPDSADSPVEKVPEEKQPKLNWWQRFWKRLKDFFQQK